MTLEGQVLSRLFPARPRSTHPPVGPFRCGRTGASSPRHPSFLRYLALLFIALTLIRFPPTQAQERKTIASQFSAGLRSLQKSYSSTEGETIGIPIAVLNSGRSHWESSGQNPCFLSYHVLNESHKALKFDNLRFPFPRKVLPGDSLTMNVDVKCPLDPGNYILEFDLVREGAAWFKDYGSKTLSLSLSIKKSEWPEDGKSFGQDSGAFTKLDMAVPEFTKLLKLIRITLGHNQVSMEGKSGEVDGFSAGAGYPQIWIRDAATIIPASRYYYREPFLRSWIEEHLAFQKQDGSLADWFDSRSVVDKNTTETDQESSMVQAAYQVTQLIGTDWLRKPIGGTKIISRLENALAFVLRERFSEKLGLIVGAHTADWGDVDMNYPDERAIETDKSTHWTADIYDQSMFYEAALDLARLFESLEEKEKTSFWHQKASQIQRNADRWLWQEKKGFYRVHLHLDSLGHNFDENNIFALGGNTQAILSGLAGGEKASSIINAALDRQKEHGITTIAASLLPPYPQGFFKHPALSDPYQYQNGGQWDWFAGKMIFAMFEHGFSRKAKEKFLEIARKDIANGGLYEWDTRDGAGRGSDFYSGSAGSLGKALFEGYLGLKLSKHSLSLEPKLGRDQARVQIYIPASDFLVAYNYRFSPKEKRIIFEYRSNFAGRGTIKLLNPWSGEEAPGSLEVRKDGQKLAFQRQKVNEDEYLLVDSDFTKHTLEIGYFRPIE